MSRSLLPIASDKLRRLCMQRTQQHILDIRQGRVPYLNEKGATVVSRELALAEEERRFEKLSTLRGR